MKKLLLLFSVTFLASNCSLISENDTDTKKNTVKDIDGNVYKTVEIGTQVWMASNLKTTRYRDGSTIPNVTGGTTWGELTTGAWVNNNNDPSNDSSFGKLYNWYAIADSSNLCPTGWHVPTSEEWSVLSNALGRDEAGHMMKSTTGWGANGNGSNASGFNGLPGGGRFDNGSFGNVGGFGLFWSISQFNSNTALSRYLYDSRDLGGAGYTKRHGFSVRCLRD